MCFRHVLDLSTRGGAAIRREKSLLSLAVLRVVRVSPSHSIKARFTASKLAIYGMEEAAGSRSVLNTV